MASLWTTSLALFITIRLLSATDSTAEHRPVIYDQETDQYFPVSDFSLRADPPFVTPDPDPNEFPPEYLESLLIHCDDPTPYPLEFLQKSWIAFKEFGLNWKRYPVSSAILFRILQAIQMTQLLHVLILAVSLSILRCLLQKFLIKYITVRMHISLRNAQRLLESSWKAFWFLILWLCSLQVVILSGRTDFQYPLRIFKGIRVDVGYFDIPTPPDYYRAYILQLGFYLHSLWSVLFIDVWRKDSAVLLIHHFMTLLLLQFSLVLRLHRIGALVLFLHDLNDVFLEVAKVIVYLRVRNRKNQLWNIWLSNLFFALFTISWIVMRLYWFPLKVLYASSWGLYITSVGRECRSFLFFNVLLWALFLMHIYWFRFIAIMAGRLVLCPSSGDMREEDSDDDALNKCDGNSGYRPTALTTIPVEGDKLCDGIEPNGVCERHFAAFPDEKPLLNGVLPTVGCN